MAKRKPSGRPPQAEHASKSDPSQHDKRARLASRNNERRSTAQASVPLCGGIATLAVAMSQMLDRRIAFRLPIILAGAMLAGGRRTAASWFRCAGVNDDWDRFYELLQGIGKNASSLMLPLLSFILRKFDPGEQGHWTLAVDDSPTKRFGPCVEAANIHHNPTPGPGDGNWLYGHNWVCLAMVLSHPMFGMMALPLLSRLYVRKVDIEAVNARHGWEFRTKHELALDLCRQVMQTLKALRSKAGFIVVFDGAYAAAALVRPLIAEGATIVTRLRSDAKLFDLPVATPGQRGRPRKYGKNRISSDTSMSVELILKTVSDRWAIEEHFHDVKEIWGAGEQQVRNVWSNVGCWNLCGWLYAIVELECWDETSEQLVDRRDRPWDNPDRRPSHSDRRRIIARKMLREAFLQDLPWTPNDYKIREQFERLLALAA